MREGQKERKSMKHRAVILAGGNVGDTEQLLAKAEQMLAEQGVEVVAKSHNYRSKAWGFESDTEFVNCAYELLTSKGAEELLDTMQGIEAALGRNREAESKVKAQRGERYASRTIDLDMMFYDEERISTERLQVPHPLIMEREFAIIPLCELLCCNREELEKRIYRICR